MTAAAANRRTVKKLNAGDRYYETLVQTAATTVYHGTMVAKVAAGTIQPATNAATSLRVVGVQMWGKTSVGGDKPRIETGEFWFANGESITNVHIGNTCYAEDDQTVKLTAGTAPIAGVITAVDSVLGVLVRIDHAERGLGA